MRLPGLSFSVDFRLRVENPSFPDKMVGITLNSYYILQIQRKKLFFNWDSLYARLNSHYKAWSYKKKKHKKIKGYRKSP